MSEEVFRVVITIGVALAVIAFLVQAGIIIALYATIRKLQAKATPVIEKAGPLVDQAKGLIAKAGPGVEKANGLIATVGEAAKEYRPRIAGILATTHHI